MKKLTLIILIALVPSLAGCALHFEAEYLGQSAKSDSHFTPDKKPVVKNATNNY